MTGSRGDLPVLDRFREQVAVDYLATAVTVCSDPERNDVCGSEVAFTAP